MYKNNVNTPKEISNICKLHIAVVKEIMSELRDRDLVGVLNEVDEGGYRSFRYNLSENGRSWARDALDKCNYIGPAPVSLREYQRKVGDYSVTQEEVTREVLLNRFSYLTINSVLEQKIGPAVNSGRSILLYGDAGNGKSTIASAVASCFQGDVFVPYCLEVDGETIKIFDPSVHIPANKMSNLSNSIEYGGQRSEFTDRRWVLCKRPIVTVGGELTLDMLDLYFNKDGGFYEAPLQVKANCGTLIIDDLGRQLVQPKDMLNRWIVPMERREDFLVLQSGGSFSVPFDNLLIFSTNLNPRDLMDAAFLRRIPYKFKIDVPSEEEFGLVFSDVCKKENININQQMIDFAINEIKSVYKKDISFYQPKFIVEQIIANSKYLGMSPVVDTTGIRSAISNIWADSV